MVEVYCTPYRVSTITCNADIGNNINVDLSILFEHINIKQDNNSFIWIQYLKENLDNSKGIYPKKKRKSKKDTTKKNRFDNQITVIYKMADCYMPNVKIFKNGNIQLTGIRNYEDTNIIVDSIINEIKRIFIINNKILHNPDDLNNLKYQNFKIRMINTDFKVFTDKEYKEQYHIRRKELHKLLISEEYNNKCSFQPGIYQGVKLEYFWNLHNKNKNGICCCDSHCFGKGNGTTLNNCKKVTIAIFESGSILITGAIAFEQVDDAYKYICNILIKNEKIIRKPDLLKMCNENLNITQTDKSLEVA
jgi:TATA-box binding protein (TBP) (component of TFIID and TFIIIB)